MEEFELVVVGAGIYGLPVAKTFLEVHPTSSLLVLDTQSTVGGTWAAERIYPELVSNNLVGTFEYSDFPMDVETFGVPPGSPVPGMVMHKYLTAYAQHFSFFSKIRFNSNVKSVELLQDNSWNVTYGEKSNERKSRTIKAKKLVLATGSTSLPDMPEMNGLEQFGGEVFHIKEMAARKEVIKTVKNVAVLGGSKSAADVAYLAATQGKHVDWIIRESGRGPSWLTYSHVSPFHLQFEKLTTTRFLSFFSPSFDNDSYTAIRYFLHNTVIGRGLVILVFSVINADLISRGRFNDHPDTKKLIPRNNIFWCGSTVGVFNYPQDLFSFVKQGLVQVHVADIKSLSHHTIHLADDSTLDSDVLVCCTGWKHTSMIQFLPQDIIDKVGHYEPSSTDPDIQAADQVIMRRFPELRESPPSSADKASQSFYTLYRGGVPPEFLNLRNLAYSGMAPGIRGCMFGEIHALWMIAYFDDNLKTPLPSVEEAKWEAMLQSRFYRWRAPDGLGFRGPDVVFETMPFVDTLLRDLGLETKRKGGWWKELFEWYGVADYKGLVREWLGQS